ncbi:hypothetical protein EIP91_012407 [Steccherinum ochraceum]|uniref:DUF6533 domain-containing protein n=1 Tax=Steccherinum ochraceum TaxID=92696 RepID=A0A4R0RN33_9APHY|nr:hypothetical protein EIP91_012407 [Steccherinum ochraceum]
MYVSIALQLAARLIDISALSGGGTGGLALAFALARKRPDIAIDVYEAQASFSEFGAGIALCRVDLILCSDPFEPLGMDGAFLHVFDSAVDDVHTIRYFSLAASIVVFYDLAITWDQEVELIWTAPWSLGKGLYFMYCLLLISTTIVDRYLCLTDTRRCLHWFRWQGATGIITVAVTEAILSLRLYALWALDRRILATVLSCLLVSLTTAAALVANGMAKISASSHTIPGLPFCTRTVPPDSFFHFWIPILFSESVLFVLAIVKGVQTYKKMLGSLNRQPLLKVLIRDSALYFLVVFATYLGSAIVFLTGSDTQMECVICFAVAMASVMGNRLCLNIRSLAERLDLTDDTTQTPLSNLSFSHTLPYLKTQDDSRAHSRNMDIEAYALAE